MFESSPIGPFDHWPHPGGGFEHFYGFIGGENNQWYPALYEQTTPVEPWGTPEEGYHLMADLADRAILWMRQQKSMAPDKPFFAYFAPGATHAPHHVPQEWIAKYKGKFDQGWDAVREETFARQKELGVIPPECELTARHEEIPAWEEMDERAASRCWRAQMEVYAALPGVRRPPRRPRDRRARRPGDPRRHARLLHHRRQRRLGRGHADRHHQRGDGLRGARPGHARVADRAHRRPRHAARVQPLRRRLGARDGHAVPVDQAGRLALRRHAQRHDRALARRASPPRARSATSSTTSSTSRRPSSTRPGCRSRRWSTASSRSRCTA